jgi:hypothetical protein
MEEYESADPADVDLLRPKAVVAPTQADPDLIEQPGLQGRVNLTGGCRRIQQCDLQCGRAIPAPTLKNGLKSLIRKISQPLRWITSLREATR